MGTPFTITLALREGGGEGVGRGGGGKYLIIAHRVVRK